MKFRLLQVSRLTRSSIYQPLAAVLAVVLMPTFAWMESAAGIPLGQAAKAFQGSAQVVVQGCGTSRGNLIIQNVCVNGTSYDVNGDLTQLESDAVNAYLTEHSLPASAAGLIYSEGRLDLRNAIRGQMVAILLAIITKPAGTRTAHEAMLYNWMQAIVQQNEIAEYKAAVSAYQAWQANPCNFTLDPAIAAQYGLSYNGQAACEPASVAAAGPPFVPAAAYFTAFGLEQSYGKPSQTNPDFAAMVTSTGVGMGEALAISTGAGAFIAGVSASVVGAFLTEIFPFATFAGDWAAILYVDGVAVNLAPAVASSAAGSAAAASGTIGTIGTVIGTAAIVFVCVVMAGVAAYEVVENQQNLNQLNNLPNLLAQAQSTPPDLNAFATDTTGLGDTKIIESLVAQTLPDVPSTAPLPAHGAGDPAFYVSSSGSSSGTVQSTFAYDDWNGIAWQATTSGGWFDLTCQGNSSGQGCTQADSFNASIHFVDWNGKNRIASRLGANFLIADLQPSSGEQPCPADPSTGLSTAGNLNNCSSYVASQINYMYQGNQYSVQLSHLPAFTNIKTIYFTRQGPQQNAIVTAEGLPAPTISLVSGVLPSGSEFLGSNLMGYGNGEFLYTGYQGANLGTYQVTLQATNSYGTTTQTFTIIVAQQLQITSPGALVGNYGQPLNFLVSTTGALPMTLSVTPGLLPSGLNFQDNGNGTATISGTPTEVYNVIPICVTLTGQPPCTPPGITASNGEGTVNQALQITINPPPQPALTVNTATFIAGVANTFTVTTSGATTPVAFEFSTLPGSTPIPSWLSFRDNGNGTGVLTGTPPQGTSGSYTFELNPYPNVQIEGVDFTNLYTFTINVSDQPAFLSSNTASFVVEIPQSFTIATNETSGTITETGALPNGLEFTDNGNGTATISGTPAPGSGGLTTLQLSITGSNGTGTQALNIQIDQAPAFVTQTWVNFYVGQENSFAVQVSGYPLVGNSPVSATNPTYAAGGVWFSLPGLPAGLTWSNLNPEGYNTGTLIISGDPASTDVGQHSVLIAANNGISATPGSLDTVANQTLTLNVAIPGDVNGDGQVNCADIAAVRAAFGTYRGQPGYNPMADVNNDGVINIEDLAIVSRNLPEGTACH